MFCTQSEMKLGIRSWFLDSYAGSATCQPLDLGKVKVTCPLSTSGFSSAKPGDCEGAVKGQDPIK